MKIEIVEGTVEHAMELVPNLRDFEQTDEVEHKIGQEFAKSLLTYAALIEGKCVAVWGVQVKGVLADEGYIWVLGSKALEEHPITFLRHSRRVLDDIKPNFRRLYGVVDKNNPCAIDWLTWLGFEIDEAGVFSMQVK